MNIGFAFCGSFCTYGKVFPCLKELAQSNEVMPIFSPVSAAASSRFGCGEEFVRKAQEITGHEPILTIAEAEPIGPKKLLDILVIAPCTGNTLAKLAHSIADTPVTMAVKSHLRNGRPVLVAVSTNDGLAGAAENIGRLLAKKHYYFVPFGQDDPEKKPTSLVADFDRIPEAIAAAMEGTQLQPLLIGLS